jgi:predicted nucleic acid-binding protein
MIYLDSNIVIYAVEQPPPFGPKAMARLGAARASGDRFTVGDSTRLECRCQPLRRKDAGLLRLFDIFFAAPDMRVVPLPTAVFDRATTIRADFKYRLPDALHLAAAVESACDVFLTNDARLAGFKDISVEVLPP